MQPDFTLRKIGLKQVKIGDLVVKSIFLPEDMFWHEYYLFYSNGTFLKSREQNSSVKEATGTYEIQTLSDGDYFILSFKTGYDLIGSCSSQENKEYLHFISATKMSNTWNACDGPGLTYERVE